VGLLVLLLSPLASTAQKPAPSGVRKPESDEARARALFKEGQTAYDIGQFARALDLYAEAYKARPLPGFLFNIAQCHRQLGNFKEAGFFFGRFIDNSKPETANVELARELALDMNRREKLAEDAEEKRRAEEATAAARAADAPLAANLDPSQPNPLLPPPPPPPIEEPPVYQKGWFWGVVLGGAALVAGGVVAAVVANQPRVLAYTPTSTTLPDIDARSTR
jgi:tetratricopeptide (TPR) repeat protein